MPKHTRKKPGPGRDIKADDYIKRAIDGRTNGVFTTAGQAAYVIANEEFPNRKSRDEQYNREYDALRKKITRLLKDIFI